MLRLRARGNYSLAGDLCEKINAYAQHKHKNAGRNRRSVLCRYQRATAKRGKVERIEASFRNSIRCHLVVVRISVFQCSYLLAKDSLLVNDVEVTRTE